MRMLARTKGPSIFDFKFAFDMTMRSEIIRLLNKESQQMNMFSHALNSGNMDLGSLLDNFMPGMGGMGGG